MYVAGVEGISKSRYSNSLDWQPPVSGATEGKELSGTRANPRPKPPDPERGSPAVFGKTNGASRKSTWGADKEIAGPSNRRKSGRMILAPGSNGRTV